MRYVSAALAALLASPAWAGSRISVPEPMKEGPVGVVKTAVPAGEIPGVALAPLVPATGLSPSIAAQIPVAKEGVAQTPQAQTPAAQTQLSQAAVAAAPQQNAAEQPQAMTAVFDGAMSSVRAVLSLSHAEAASVLGVAQLGTAKVTQHSYQNGALTLQLKAGDREVETTWSDLAFGAGKLLSWQLERTAEPVPGEERVAVALKLAGRKAKDAAKLASMIALELPALGAQAVPAIFSRQPGGDVDLRYEFSAEPMVVPAVVEAIRGVAARRGRLARLLGLGEAPVDLSWRVVADRPKTAPRTTAEAVKAAIAAANPDTVEHAKALVDWTLPSQDASYAAQELRTAIEDGRGATPEVERVLREGLTNTLAAIDAAVGGTFKEGNRIEDRFVAQTGSEIRPSFRLTSMLSLYGAVLKARPELLRGDASGLLIGLLAAGSQERLIWITTSDGYGSSWTTRRDVAATRVCRALAEQVLEILSQIELTGPEMEDLSKMRALASSLSATRGLRGKLFGRKRTDAAERAFNALSESILGWAASADPMTILPKLAAWDAETGEWVAQANNRALLEELVKRSNAYAMSVRRPR